MINNHRQVLLPIAAPVALVAALVAAEAVGAPQQQTERPEAIVGVRAPAPPTNVINMILVKVNGEPILLSDLQSVEEDQVAILRQQIPESEVQAQLPELRAGMLRALIDEKMMLQRADMLGLTADANMVDRQIQEVREANGLTNDEEFEAALAQLGMTVEDMREQMRKTLRRQQLVYEEVNRNIFVSEGEITAYFAENQEEFAAPERVRLEQLVFLLEGGDPQALRQQAEAALGELRDGEGFDAVAGKYTNGMAFSDESFIAVSDLNETLAAAVPGLEENTYSEVLQSDFGFQIVKVVERQEHAVSPLDDVREDIRSRLTTAKSQERMTRYLSGLRDKTILEIFDPAFANIEEAWKAPPEGQQVGAR